MPTLGPRCPRRVRISAARPTAVHVLAPALAVPLAALVLVAGGCRQSPFAAHPIDYTRVIDPDRVRTIAPLLREPYRVEETAGEDGEGVDLDPAANALARLAGRETAEVSIEDARLAVLQNNLDLGVSLVNPIIANENVSEQEARFNAVFNVTARWAENDAVVFSDLESGQSRQQFIQPEVVVPLRTGGQLAVRVPVGFVQTDNALTFVNKSRSSDVEFSISHPLLRGAGRRANTYAIRVADLNRQLTETQTKLAVLNQIAAVERASWPLFAVREALVVRQQQLELAQEQLSSAERLNRAGRTPEVEVVRAQAGVASRLEGIILAQNAVLNQQRALKRLMNIPGLDVDTSTLIVPASPPDPVEYRFDPEVLTQVALEERMELLEVEIQLITDRELIALRKNEALWDLSVEAAYSVNGRGLTLGESFGTLNDNRFTDWSVGARASVPIGNQERESRLEQAKLQRLQRLGTHESRRQLITQEVYDATDRVASDWQRIMAAQQSVILNTRALEAEQRQFDVGSTTSNDVLDADTRLAEARLTEIQAVADYQISQINLAAATGTLLGQVRIDWSPIDPRDVAQARDLVDDAD